MTTEQHLIAITIGLLSVIIVVIITKIFKHIERRNDLERRLEIIGRGGSDKLEH